LDDVAGMIEREAGPSWGRPGWPVAVLDDLNIGLDPTQASIDAVRVQAAATAA